MNTFPPFAKTLASPADLWIAQVQLAGLAVDAQAVIGFRMLGLLGLWAVAPSENKRMVDEKPLAFARSANAAIRATMAGKRPDEIMAAAVKPLRSRTSSNMRRLARRGPQVGPR